MAVEAGQPAPEFDLPTAGGGRARLADFKGRPLVLYFYPKDDTPGCTKEAQGFAEAYPEFQAAGIEVVGVSKDGTASHDRFKAKYESALHPGLGRERRRGRGIRLLGREEHRYGRKYMGIDRSTFLIDCEGNVRRVWSSVAVPGHVAEVLDAARALR